MSVYGEWTMAAREARLASLGVRYTSIRRAIDPDIRQVGKRKGETCNELGAILIFDDSIDYLAGLATVSATKRLLVLP